MRYPLDKEAACRLVGASLFWDAPGDAAFAKAAGTARAADAPCRDVLVMGAFDGLHQGHRSLLAAARTEARALGLPCHALTFDPDPSDLLRPDAPQPHLLSVADRARGLRALGADRALVVPFTQGLAACTPEEFVRTQLLGMVRPQVVYVGKNFRFGRRAAGTSGTLRGLGERYGFEVREVSLLASLGARVSSTRIRDLLATPGALDEATELLARHHFVRGTIEHGRGEGTSFGFPTANVRCATGSCMPAAGVYGGYVTIDGTAWPAAINVGAPPSFAGPDELFLEANLIGFSGDVYGASACVTFVRWLRPSRVFSSLDELERTVLGNIGWVRDNLGEGGVRLA